MNIKKIKELIELMNDNGLAEIEIEQDGTKIKLAKGPRGVVEQVVSSADVAERREPAHEEVAGPPEKARNLKEVQSPMVGTFYRSPSPEADPYVQIGDIVQKGDVLCIVEAMKLMNEVKAEFGGRIVEIAVENAEPVEFGQTLYMIEAV